ncbi:hypothetical protein JW796_00850 [Candidatus Dojkabacteria bacterium]|nr:hypothetical protein [Candidatus Dojkabacteria bacterium]
MYIFKNYLLREKDTLWSSNVQGEVSYGQNGSELLGIEKTRRLALLSIAGLCLTLCCLGASVREIANQASYVGSSRLNPEYYCYGIDTGFSLNNQGK